MFAWFDGSFPAGSRRAAALLSGCLALLGCGLFGYEELPGSSSNAIGAHCSNAVQDADEAGLDCGGSDCAGCQTPVCVGDGCGDLTCGGLPCPAASCADGVQNQDETATDCGGTSCAPCQAPVCTGTNCEPPPPCVGVICVAATCSDAIQNQDETAIDCGGVTCSPCPSCSDAIQNQDETAIDCGGVTCSPCPSCSDAIQNQDETATDCGGVTCSPCPSCSDGIQNQDETGIDCGGVTCSACPTCSDAIQNQDETAIDCGGSSCTACGVNTPPLARMTVTPSVGSHDGTPATVFQGDASGTTDREDPPNTLTYAWDWDNDGVTDATGITSTHTYGSAGVFEARLGVQDTGGLSATTTFLVIVSSESSIVRVTTQVDENDAAATPASPGGTGLSLREAINFANTAAGRQSIFVPAGFAIALTRQLPNPGDALGMDIVGDGVVLDGTATNPADDCIGVTTPQNRIFGFEIQNCRRSPLRLGFGAANSHFSRLDIHDNPLPVVFNDVNVRFGPHNEVSRSAGHCVSVVGNGAIIDFNYLHECDRCLDLTGSNGALVLGNVLTGCNHGILFGNGADDVAVLHNVIHGNTGDGILVSALVSGTVFQNNILSNNGGFGLRAADDAFSANDHNDYFGNITGTCTACSSLGTGSLLSDPKYIDTASFDFRLQPSSPNINAGIDTGEDINGPEPGNGLFNGSNPDIGASESN